MMYIRSLGPYVRLPFAKSLRGQIAPLHTGRNLGSIVIDLPGRHPKLPHSPSNIHHTVEVMVRPVVTEATRITGPHKSSMCQYTTQTCSPGTDNRSLTDRSEGYHCGALNIFLSTLTLPIR
jgi:hypothetical protein